MRFNDQHLVDLSTLSKEEAQAFVTFLKAELLRHDDEHRIADREALSQDLLGDSALAQFWHSAMMRHKEDAEGCVKSITEVTEAHGL